MTSSNLSRARGAIPPHIACSAASPRDTRADMGASKKDNGKSPAAAKSGDEKPKSGDEKLTPAQIKAAKAGGKKGGKPARPPKKGTSNTGSSSGLVLPALAVVAAAVGPQV